MCQKYKKKEKVMSSKEEFLYKEYAVYQPLQRNYAITYERIASIEVDGVLSNLYDQYKVDELQLLDPIPTKEKKVLDKYIENKPTYDKIIQRLKDNVSDTIYKKESEFREIIKGILNGIDSKMIDKIVDGLSVMDKTAEVHKDKNGEIIYDSSTKDIEIVKFTKNVDEYMNEEVLPHAPDAAWFFEENMNAKKPVVKTGAEFPVIRYFYEYKAPEAVEDLEKEFIDIENSINAKLSALFEEV